MRIVVLVKYVPEPTASLVFAKDFTLDRGAVPGHLSELDEYAVEQATRLGDAGVAAQVSYLTMGPDRAVEGLRKALAIGGDSAVHVLDDAIRGSDAVTTSGILAAALERMGFDLILSGMASTDAEMSVVPIMVADRLGVPALLNAGELRVDAGQVTVRRDTDDATEEVVVGLPALVSVTDRSGEVRYPSFKAIITGKKKPVTTWSLSDLDLTPERVGVAGAATVVRTIRPRPAREPGTVITDDGDAAARLADYLVAGKLL